MSQQDAVVIARLVEDLHDEGVRGTSPGVPQDVPPEIQPIRTFRIGAGNCREGGVAQVSSPVACRLDPPPHGGHRPAYLPRGLILNPLRADPETFAQVYELRAKPIDPAVGCMPIPPLPDQQAAVQRGAYGMAMALAGRRDFRWGGLLSQDLVFSPVQLLLDLAMIRCLL